MLEEKSVFLRVGKYIPYSGYFSRRAIFIFHDGENPHHKSLPRMRICMRVQVRTCVARIINPRISSIMHLYGYT